MRAVTAAATVAAVSAAAATEATAAIAAAEAVARMVVAGATAITRLDCQDLSVGHQRSAYTRDTIIAVALTDTYIRDYYIIMLWHILMLWQSVFCWHDHLGLEHVHVCAHLCLHTAQHARLLGHTAWSEMAARSQHMTVLIR